MNPTFFALSQVRGSSLDQNPAIRNNLRCLHRVASPSVLELFGLGIAEQRFDSDLDIGLVNLSHTPRRTPKVWTTNETVNKAFCSNHSGFS